MKDLLSFAFLTAAFTTLAWASFTPPLPQDNAKAFDDCIKLHPQKYCIITYHPSKAETMGKN